MTKITMGLTMAGCLLVGALVSVAVAWGAEYLNTPLPPFNASSAVVHEVGRGWPLPISEWPAWTEGADRPERPSTVFTYRPALGARVTLGLGSQNGTTWFVKESRSGWPMGCAARFTVSDTGMPLPKTIPAGSRENDRPWYAGWNLVDKAPTNTWAQPEPVYFPVQPVWFGLAVNSMFYGGSLHFAAFGVGRIRRARRRRRGCCEACGYPIGVGPVCSECGAAPRP